MPRRDSCLLEIRKATPHWIDVREGVPHVVTADGVETQEQLERLQSINCDRAQGIMFSSPMTPEDAGR
jgi:Amt family ammonium transporter